MKLLLDTHVFLWLNDDSERISETVKDLCSSGTHEFYLSMASPWEMQIKSQQVGWARFCQLSRMASSLSDFPLNSPTTMACRTYLIVISYPKGTNGIFSGSRPLPPWSPSILVPEDYPCKSSTVTPSAVAMARKVLIAPPRLPVSIWHR